MTIKINYLNKNKNKSLSKNIVLFSNEKFKINNLKNFLSKSEFVYIEDLIKTIDPKKNIFLFELTSKRKIVLISIKNTIKTSEVENLGAEFYGRIKNEKNNEYFLVSDSLDAKHINFLGPFLHGLKLKSYEFKTLHLRPPPSGDDALHPNSQQLPRNRSRHSHPQARHCHPLAHRCYPRPHRAVRRRQQR